MGTWQSYPIKGVLTIQFKCVISREGVVTMRHSPIDPFCSTVRPDLHCHDSYIRINNLCTKVSYAILIYYIVTYLIILLFYLNLSFWWIKYRLESAAVVHPEVYLCGVFIVRHYWRVYVSGLKGGVSNDMLICIRWVKCVLCKLLTTENLW